MKLTEKICPFFREGGRQAHTVALREGETECPLYRATSDTNEVCSFGGCVVMTGPNGTYDRFGKVEDFYEKGHKFLVDNVGAVEAHVAPCGACS